MPKSFEKTRKLIAKKKPNITALHEGSRDSQRLHRAKLRDDRLIKVASARRKNEQPLLERVAYFQEVARNLGSLPVPLEAIREHVKSYLAADEQLLSDLKSQRRSGRPASAREDLLRMKVAGLEKEYRDGFFMPDLTDADNVVMLDRWEGSWSYLSTLKWIRLSQEGVVTATAFPPKGQA